MTITKRSSYTPKGDHIVEAAVKVNEANNNPHYDLQKVTTRLNGKDYDGFMFKKGMTYETQYDFENNLVLTKVNGVWYAAFME